MVRILNNRRAVTGLFLSATALASLVFASVAAAQVTPIKVRTGGSTTVGPLTEAAELAFEATRPNVDLHVPTTWQGSGISWNGVNQQNLTLPEPAPVENGGGAGTYMVTLGQSSRGPNSGEGGRSHVFHVATDAMIVCVNNSAAMGFLNGQITIGQLQTIWEAGGNTTIYRGTADVDGTFDARLLQWNDINPSWPTNNVVAVSRNWSSGTYSDWILLNGLDANKEMKTQNDYAGSNGLNSPSPFNANNVENDLAFSFRSATGGDQATKCDTTDHLIAYTGLANVASLPNPAGIIELQVRDDVGIFTDPGTSQYVAPTLANLANDTYPLPRKLFYVVRRITPNNAFTPSYPGMPRDAAQGANFEIELNMADDFINFIYANPGIVAGVDLAPVAPKGSNPPFPDWDVNLNGTVSISDVSPIGQHFGESNPVPGWTRADVNNNGSVSISDVSPIGQHFGETGFVAPPEDALAWPSS